MFKFFTFHRWAGLSSFALLLLLSVTGIMLNHTDELGLDKSYIDTQWLQTWYGIKMPEQQGYLQLNDGFVAQLGKQFYFNETRLPDENSPMLGGVKLEQYMVVGFKKALYLLMPSGELIEKLDEGKGLPTPISRIGFSKTAANTKHMTIEVDEIFYGSFDNFLSWEPIENKSFTAFELEMPKSIGKAFYQEIYLGNELTLERLVLDLHSGRLFGSLGIYLMDIAAIILIMLGLSGTWVWSRRMFNRKTKSRKTMTF